MPLCLSNFVKFIIKKIFTEDLKSILNKQRTF